MLGSVNLPAYPSAREFEERVEQVLAAPTAHGSPLLADLLQRPHLHVAYCARVLGELESPRAMFYCLDVFYHLLSQRRLLGTQRSEDLEALLRAVRGWAARVSRADAGVWKRTSPGAAALLCRTFGSVAGCLVRVRGPCEIGPGGLVPALAAAAAPERGSIPGVMLLCRALEQIHAECVAPLMSPGSSGFRGNSGGGGGGEGQYGAAERAGLRAVKAALKPLLGPLFGLLAHVAGVSPVLGEVSWQTQAPLAAWAPIEVFLEPLWLAALDQALRARDGRRLAAAQCLQNLFARGLPIPLRLVFLERTRLLVRTLVPIGEHAQALLNVATGAATPQPSATPPSGRRWAAPLATGPANLATCGA